MKVYLDLDGKIANSPTHTYSKIYHIQRKIGFKKICCIFLIELLCMLTCMSLINVHHTEAYEKYFPYFLFCYLSKLVKIKKGINILKLSKTFCS